MADAARRQSSPRLPEQGPSSSTAKSFGAEPFHSAARARGRARGARRAPRRARTPRRPAPRSAAAAPSRGARRAPAAPAPGSIRAPHLDRRRRRLRPHAARLHRQGQPQGAPRARCAARCQRARRRAARVVGARRRARFDAPSTKQAADAARPIARRRPGARRRSPAPSEAACSSRSATSRARDRARRPTTSASPISSARALGASSRRRAGRRRRARAEKEVLPDGRPPGDHPARSISEKSYALIAGRQVHVPRPPRRAQDADPPGGRGALRRARRPTCATMSVQVASRSGAGYTSGPHAAVEEGRRAGSRPATRIPICSRACRPTRRVDHGDPQAQAHQPRPPLRHVAPSFAELTKTEPEKSLVEGLEEVRRAQRARPQDRAPPRRRRQAPVPPDRLQAPQGRRARQGRRDRVRPQPDRHTSRCCTTRDGEKRYILAPNAAARSA